LRTPGVVVQPAYEWMLAASEPEPEQ